MKKKTEKDLALEAEKKLDMLQGILNAIMTHWRMAGASLDWLPERLKSYKETVAKI